MEVVKELVLDFSAENPIQTVTAKQSDTNSRFLIIEPVNNGEKMDMNEITAVFCAEKPDGKNIINYCMIDNENRIFLELTNQTLALSGIVQCEIKLYKNTAVLSSCPFCIEVIKSISNNEIESENEYTLLTTIIEDYQKIIKSAIEGERRKVFLAEVIESKIIEQEYEEEE